MQEIDFGPTGNSVNGDLFPRASGALERGSASLSGSNSLSRSMGYQKTAGAGGLYGTATGYGDEGVAQSEHEYVTDPGLQVDYDSGLNRQGTLGTASNYSAAAASGYSAAAASVPHFYPTNAASSRPPAPYTNYAPYPGQYGAPPPPPIRYEPPSSALNYDYTTPAQYPAANSGPNGDYHR